MRRLLILMAALALVGAACGGDDDSSTTAASGDTSATTAAPAPTGAQALADACTLGETDGDLNLYNWSEYIPTGSLAEEFEVTDLIAAFEEEFGVNVVLTEYDSNETMLAQIDAGVDPMKNSPSSEPINSIGVSVHWTVASSESVGSVRGTVCRLTPRTVTRASPGGLDEL